ncbi:phosphoribosylformylglycinamidine synthase [miscellaneous Crenarchaeota group-1 archaeon SG8-32-1]|uniref:Phosphoribosylformylglycinamidine synthase n=1 Tax=miscellaneous Crenarchaeota group-1 archaeon SG8-32-1 TaxID=1685124 RepID=A0A0M0BP40_9ARCH|nr:MAG: phosphoribosylformylglycinamidine synthase [miscellaneous Crenarchaeota group-1 archaeon SG8-32-1]
MDKALQTMIDNMPEKTGKSLEQWKALLAKKSFSKHSESVNFLKKEYGVTHGFANTIVQLSKTDNENSDDLLTNQYKGKENLLPIYKALISVVKSFGKDVTITPKKGSVSVIRKKQFTLIKPATKTRIDLGLKLKDKPTTKRLQNSGPFGTMCTHRVQISKVEEIDSELKKWLKEAYTKAI